MKAESWAEGSAVDSSVGADLDSASAVDSFEVEPIVDWFG